MDKLCEIINRQCCLHCEMECDGKWLETEIEIYKEDLLKKQADKIADLEAKLAEKEKEIEKHKRIIGYVLQSGYTQKEFNEMFKKSTLIAIDELENVKERFADRLTNFFFPLDYRNTLKEVFKQIDQQIKSLRGE